MKQLDKGSKVRITERLSLRVFFLTIIRPKCKQALRKESTIKRSLNDLELFEDQCRKSARII